MEGVQQNKRAERRSAFGGVGAWCIGAALTISGVQSAHFAGGLYLVGIACFIYAIWIHFREKPALAIASSLIVCCAATLVWALLLRNHQPPTTGDISKSSRPPSPLEATSKPVFIDPPDALKANADGTSREFVRITPAEISAMLKDKTENQSRALVKPYSGKWMALSGVVEDSSTEDRGETNVSIDSWKDPAYSSSILLLVFDNEWKDKLEFLKKGEVINAVCRIHTVTPLILESCERFER